MATYRPSFVDISGLSEGISQGLEMAAKIKRQEDALAEARIDDFMKMYQPGKLMQNHIPEFTNAYNNYKQAALQYTKLNRGGANPEQLAASKAMMDNALTGLNNVYSTSVKTAEKLAETSEVMKFARTKGLSIPEQLNNDYKLLSSSPVSQLSGTIDKMPSAYSYNIQSEDIDYTKLFKDLDVFGAQATKETQYVVSKNPSYTYMGNPIYTRTENVIATRNPVAIAKSLPSILADPTHNAVKNRMDRQFKLFKDSDAAAKAATVDRLKPIFGVTSADQVTPDMLISYDLASSNVLSSKEDEGFKDVQIREIDTRLNLQQKSLDRAADARKQQDKNASSDWHPSVKIKGIVEQVQPSMSATDYSNDFKGYEMKDKAGYAVPIDEVQYVGGDNKSVKPYFKVRLKGEDEYDILQPQAFNSRIVTAMSDVNFQKGAVPLSGIKYKAQTTTPPKGKSQGKDPLGLGIK